MKDKMEIYGILSAGYGIIPKKFMQIKFEHTIGKQKGQSVKIVLAYLLTFSGQGNNSCFPSVTNISKNLEMARSTVIEALKNAKKLGLISITHPVDENGKEKQNNIYTLEFMSEKKPELVRSSNQNQSDHQTRTSSIIKPELVRSSYCINNNINNNNINNIPGLSPDEHAKNYYFGYLSWADVTSSYDDMLRDYGKPVIVNWSGHVRALKEIVAYITRLSDDYDDVELRNGISYMCDLYEATQEYFDHIATSKREKKGQVFITPRVIWNNINNTQEIFFKKAGIK